MNKKGYIVFWIILSVWFMNSAFSSHYTIHGKKMPNMLSDPPGSYVVSAGEYLCLLLDTISHAVFQIDAQTTQVTGGFQSNGGASQIYASAHYEGLIDRTGQLWLWGVNNNGQLGTGNTTNTGTPTQVTQDSSGAAWPGTGKTVVYIFLQFETTIAVLSDGTVWGCGDLSGGQRASPGGVYTGSTTTTRMVKLNFTGNPFIRKVVVGYGCFGLDSAGNVYSWGGSGPQMGLGSSGSTVITTPTHVTLPSAAADINATLSESVVTILRNGSLYGWGFNMGFLGIGPPGIPGNLQFWYEAPTFGGINHPVLLDTALNFTHPVANDPYTGFKKFASNWNGMYVILTDSTLWYWGDKANGCGGDGVEANYATTSPPYAWNQGPGFIWYGNANTSAFFNQRKPTHITPGIQYMSVYTNNALTPYTYATWADGTLTAWGRGKAGALGDNMQSCDALIGGIDATYPNGYDRVYPTPINYDSLFTGVIKKTTCPYCIPNPSGSPCNNCTNPPTSTVSPLLQLSQGVGNTIIFLSGATSSRSYYFPRYFVYQVGGPTLTIPDPVNKTFVIGSVPNGTYSFRMQAIDQWWDSASTTVQTISINNVPSNSKIPIKRGWKPYFH